MLSRSRALHTLHDLTWAKPMPTLPVHVIGGL